MRIEKQLLLKILAKHGIEYNAKTKVSEVIDYNKDDVAIIYGTKTLPFEAEWLDTTIIANTLIPTDKKAVATLKIKQDLKYLGIKGQLYQTKLGDRYISFDSVKQAPDNIELSDLTEEEKAIFEKARKQYKNVVDEFAYRDRITRMDAHRQNQIYIENDETTDLVYIDTVSNPKKGCDRHQGKIHSKSGKNKNYPSLLQAREDGFQWANCRHSARPYYKGLTKLPRKEKGTYLGSQREKEVQNSAKIRRLQYQNDRLDPIEDADKIKQNKAKINALKKDGYMPFRTITTFK